jgi:serine/threonine protein kinase/tetratricopeptide (TPR) repeat protein
VIGQTIAHYRVTAKLGQGGMGEVYRATDTKLDREVAIKVLPEEFAAHPERMARFEREAKSLAKLNHPNIAAIHGFDQHKGKWFLVLELVDGETLAERIARGPLDLQEALKIFQQIAEALEAAHAKDIVHRDLKPANIKIDTQGRVKVLDFGLAKARTEKPAHADSEGTTADSMATTITSEFTMPGNVIGTAAYMSPEQSRGQEVDKRTDVWAFGCCLYEALTGRRPFKGQTTSDLLAEILKIDPDWTTLPPETPREVVTLLRRCLEKETRRRLRDIGDIAITLEETSNVSRLELTTTQPTVVAEPSSDTTSESWSIKTILQTVGSVVLALGFAYAVFDLVVGIENAPSGRSAQSVESIRSVAVLKIEPIGGDSDLAVVANGLESDIRAQLRRIDGLERHPAPRTVEKLAESEKLDSEIAGELGVDGLVYGRINRDGDEIDLNVSLVHGPTATTLWETNFASANPKALETQMVLSLLEQFDVPLADAERTYLERSDDVSIEAYTEYRKGLLALDMIGFANANEAIARFAKARELDPDFLPPYIQQAWALWWPTIYGTDAMTASEAFGKAIEVLDAAEHRFPEESIIEPTKAFFRMISEFEFKEAKTTLETALLNSPNDPDLHFMYMWYLLLVESRYPEAMRSINRAIVEDPGRIGFRYSVAEVYSFMGEDEEALGINSKIADKQLNDFDLLLNISASHRNLGNWDEALRYAEEALRIADEHPGVISYVAAAQAGKGESSEARRLLGIVESKRKEGFHVPHIFSALVVSMLGDTDEAVELYREAHANKEGFSFLFALRYPRTTMRMADEPGYWELINEMGYPPFPIDHPLYDLEQEKRFKQVASTSAKSTIRNKDVSQD